MRTLNLFNLLTNPGISYRLGIIDYDLRLTSCKTNHDVVGKAPKNIFLANHSFSYEEMFSPLVQKIMIFADNT